MEPALHPACREGVHLQPFRHFREARRPSNEQERCCTFSEEVKDAIGKDITECINRSDGKTWINKEKGVLSILIKRQSFWLTGRTNFVILSKVTINIAIASFESNLQSFALLESNLCKTKLSAVRLLQLCNPCIQNLIKISM